MNILFLTSPTPLESHLAFVSTLATQLGKEVITLSQAPQDWAEWSEQNDVDMLVISCANESKAIQRALNQCRDLRIPYLFLTDTMQHIRPLQTILVPVTRLEEEVHKAQTAAHLARYTKALLLLLKANDYGSRATQNCQKMGTLFEKMEVNYQLQVAKKDSEHLFQEVTDRQKDFVADLVVLTASRDYGLDDLFFGPPERKVIQRSNAPVVLLNPRGDLYSLCD